MENEVGRELMAYELVERTVVVLRKKGRPMVTSWVVTVATDFVMFHSDVVKTTLLLKRNLDGTMEDDSSTRIHVYQYLGEV